MSETNTPEVENTEFFNENELKEVLKSLESEEVNTLSQEQLDKVAKAWASVKKDKLYN